MIHTPTIAYMLSDLGGRPVEGLRHFSPDCALARWPVEERRAREICAWWLPPAREGAAPTFDAYPGGAAARHPFGAVLVTDPDGRPAYLEAGVIRRRGEP